MNLSSFSSYRDYSFSLYFVKCRRTLLELNYFEGPYPSSEKPIIKFLFDVEKQNSVYFLSSTIWWLDTLKRIEKIIWANAVKYKKKKKKPRLISDKQPSNNWPRLMNAALVEYKLTYSIPNWMYQKGTRKRVSTDYQLFFYVIQWTSVMGFISLILLWFAFLLSAFISFPEFKWK